MRLINTDTLSLEEFLDSEVPKYAVLSHTWGRDEVTFENYSPKSLLKTRAPAESKIRSASTQAAKHGLSYVWIDTCCIDKRSSAELQEAINSMYRYYENAAVCLVHLADVSRNCPKLHDDGSDNIRAWLEVFRESRWFSRGWCLQELIAPRGPVKFYSAAWDFIGNKETLIKTISATTRIPSSILTHRASVFSMSVAQRMSWASRRQTSRIEDQAYSLLGLFNVSLPMLYGEGSRAFIRLQEEIIRTSTDHSIFTWECIASDLPDGSLLAASPKNFEECHNIVQWGKPAGFDMTNRGLRISLPAIELRGSQAETLAILNCRYVKDLSGTLALRLLKYGGGEEYHTVKGDGPQPYHRLAYIPVRRIDFEKPKSSPRLITREFEAEASKLKFWIPPTNGDFEIVDFYPPELWDTNDGVMHAGSSDVVRGGVKIKASSGNMFNVAFGFDLLPSSDNAAQDGSVERNEEVESNGAEPQGTNDSAPAASQDDDDQDARASHRKFLLGIWGSTAQPQGGLKKFMDRSRPRCNHQHDHCKQHRCPFMSTSATVYEFPQKHKLEPRIDVASILQDTVFVVSLQSTPVFELEAFQDVLELDATVTQQPILTDTTTFTQSQAQKQMIVASVVPPLQHELEMEDIRAPIQVWIRLPKAIGLGESSESAFKWLSHRVLFASFGEYYPLATGILELGHRVTTEERVFLWFVGDSSSEWEIFVAEASRRERRAQVNAFQNAQWSRLGQTTELDSGHNLTADGMLSVSVPLQDTSMKLRVNVRRAPTWAGMACVIDLHFEREVLDAVDFGVSNLSSVVESRSEHRDINMVENVNEAMVGISDAAAKIDIDETGIRSTAAGTPSHRASIESSAAQATAGAETSGRNTPSPSMPNRPPPPPPKRGRRPRLS